jgi:ribosome biogenesis protein BRX1
MQKASAPNQNVSNSNKRKRGTAKAQSQANATPTISSKPTKNNTKSPKKAGQQSPHAKSTNNKQIQAKPTNTNTTNDTIAEQLKFKNKQKVLILGSRGITHRHRHLLTDIRRLLPHSKKENKVETKERISVINELADLNCCNNVIFFECRKRQDLYMWIGKAPNGPSAKFLVLNIHTMDELKLTGNCLVGSRPLLVFDKTFEFEPHWLLLKELFQHSFGTPKGHRRSQPFIDHVFYFSIVDRKIWFRNYQIIQNDKKERTLSEIGPRFVLHLHRIFQGSFGGPTLYLNPDYVSPNKIRAARKKAIAVKHTERLRAQQEAKAKKKDRALPHDELDDVFNE